jgi:hypothetical protein
MAVAFCRLYIFAGFQGPLAPAASEHTAYPGLSSTSGSEASSALKPMTEISLDLHGSRFLKI